MFNDEEERKKREEEAKSIINSVNIGDAIDTVNYANATNTKINVRNEQEQSLIDRINEANSIINSINPRENIPAPQEPSEEDRIKSMQNAQNLIDLMDRNTKETSVVGNDLSEKSTNQRNTQITKEELDKQIAETKTQNVKANNNQKNSSIINKNTNISIVSNPVDNTKEITPTYQKALTEAKQKNEDIQEGGLEKFEAMLDTFFDNVVGGAKQTVSGLVNLVTTGAGLGIRGLEGAAKIFGLEEAGNALNSTYNKIIDTGSNINETANYERTVNSLIEDNATKTLGDVTNVISNMGTSTLIGLALPVGVSGTAVQGLSVAGNSAQEVLDENKDNIGRATITGLAKGYTSYLTERMFDANILTKGMKKTSVQKAVDRLISNKLNSDLGKEIANRTVGILGENAEELVEDNVDNLIDKMINDKEMPGFKEWWENTTETAKITTISTLIMSLLGMGGESFHNKEVDIEADYWIDQAQQFIEQEDMAIHYNLGERKGLYDTKDFYITRFTPQGEIANIVPTRGKEIVSTSNKLNVKPAIVMDNITDMYTVIDENTGVVLDSTPYSTTVEAENGYNEKVNKLSDLQVRDINQKINNASYMVNNEFSSIIQQAKTELNQSTKTNFENINNNENVENSIEKQQNNINTLINTIDKISNKRIYKKDDTTTLLDTVSNNVKNIDFVPEDKGVGTLYSYDNEGNITKEQRLNNKFYTGRSIKNIVNTAMQNADMSYLNTGNNTQTTNISQSSSEPNTSNFYSNETNYAVQDIKKVTEPFKKQESYSKDEMAEVWNNEVSDNNYDAYYDSNGNIERYIAIEEEGNNIVVNQYDNNDNVVKSKVIPSNNGRYQASDIQDTINRVASLYDENRPIKGQRDIEGNEVKSMKKKTNSSKKIDINKSIEKFEKAKDNTDRETVVTIANSLDIKIKEGATKIENTNMSKLAGKNKTPNIVAINELFKDLTSKNIKEYRKEAESIANSLYRDKIVTIYDTQTKTEINKSGIEKTLSGNITKSKVQSINQLEDIIQQGIYGYTTYNPNDSNKILYHHFFTPVNYQNKNGLIRVVIREFTNDNSLNDKYYYHQLEFISNKKIEGINALPQINGNKEIKFLPSTKNSISQNSQTVKTSTNPKNKNMTNKTIKSLEDIKVKYKNQTDQLNIFENKDNTISINNLVVKQNLRNKGIGQNILNDIIDYADKNNKTITLTPTSKYLTKNKLTTWYKNNGFVENKGRNTDFSISDTMYRLPKNNTQNNQNVKNDDVRAMKNNKNNTQDQKKIQKELHKRIQNAILSKNSKGRTYLGDVSEKVANKIKQLLGFEISDRRHVLADNDIRHMIKQHGNPTLEKQKGQIAITTKDIEKIPDIINNYDRLVQGNNNTEGKTIRYIKKYSDNISYVVEVVPAKGNVLKIKTMWKKPVRVTNSKNTPSLTSKTKPGLGTSTSNNSISQNNQNVKDDGVRAMKNTSTKVTDSEGRTLTKQQQEYFKDSKVRDENGNLQVVYHGTNNFGFTEFKRNANYYTSREDVANTYTRNNGIYRGYLDIKNPIVIDANKEKWSMIDIDNIKIQGIDNVRDFLHEQGASVWQEKGKTRTSTADLVQSISDAIDEEQINADGIIIQNIYDEGIYSNGKSKLGTDYITFKSNQFKNLDNSSPTSNDDIRYMKKSTSKNKTNVNSNSKNLIAQHNTSEEKLMEALDLGALPVPSIAITKSDTPISNYGDITLLFNKDTINPTDRRNVAYNSDIYSTRRPQTVNSLDKNKVKTFEKFINDKGVSYGYISQIEEYLQDNDFARAKDTIRYELQKANPDVTEQEIENSFAKAMETIKDKRILREDVDPYTPSGNRRTIEQMSVPYTLDNIVRLMTKKSNKGSESNNFAGLPEVRANLSQQFKNIEEMHQQENDLVSTEEMQKAKEQLNDEFYNLIDEIGKYDKVERYFGSTDTVANALNETAKAKNISKEVLENELDFVSITNVPDKTLQKAIDFLNSLKNVPTEYFEVKPQRAVGLNEIQSAIVPKNTSKELIDKLKENNIPITYYDTQQERNKIIANETENKNIRFAKKTAKTPKVEGEILEPGQTNAQRESNYIEQEIRKIEESGNWDDSIPVTRMTDIRKTIENYLGLGVQKGHFRQQAYGIYKGNRDVIRTKELKDIDTILHETGHALDIGKRINLNKEAISDELLKAASNYGGYEAETREVQLEEGFAEVIREYTIVPNQARIDYPQTVAILEGIRQTDKEFNKFITDVQQQTYNYIHQNPRNRTLSNVSIGERTDQTKLTPAKIQQEVMRNIYDKDWALKSAVNEMQKINGKSTRDLKASENAYYLTRLSSGIGDKVISMLSKGYIDENGTKLMPGLEQLGEILGNNEQRFNDLRAYLVAQRDLEYKAKTLKTGIRTMDSKAVVEQFKNDTQIQEASKLVYDTLDGVMQYAVNNGLIDQETADSLRESNAFYVPMQRVLESNKNNVGRRGAVADVIKSRTGSELDVKDVLENIVANSANIIQQVENNNILKALYKQGEQAGMTGKIYDVIDAPMVKIGTAKLSTWERELRNQGVNTTELDLEKTIDLFAPNNKVDTNNLITSFINDNGKRVYLQFNDEILFNSLMNMDKKFMSAVLNINRKLNMPLRYGATMANIGFAIPNMISDTAQAAIFSEAGFIPVVDNVIGIMDILSVQNKSARNFFNKVVPGYADRINTLYALYEQTGATSATRMSQYRERTQSLMKDVYGTKNSEVLGIKEKYKPLKRLLDIMTYIPELSEQSTRFRVFEKNLEYYRRNGMSEMDARIEAALQSRDATQDFGRTGNITREINQLIPFSAARVGSAYTFAEKIKANPKRAVSRMAILLAISTAITALGYDDDEIEELNQRKKNDNFVLKVGDQIVTIKKPQGILRSIINLGQYVQDLFTGHIEEGKEGERLVELVQSAIMDNMPADSVTGLVPNMVAPVVENAINKDLYYNSDIVKSYDLELPDSEQYYDYNSQLAIWLGQIFNYSPAKIDNLISGYFAGLGTSVTNVIDWIAGKTGIATEQPEMGAEDNAVGKRFFVNVNSNSQSVDDVYTLKTDLTKKKNGGTITTEEEQQLEALNQATSDMASLNKQIKEIKKNLSMSGDEKAEQIKELQRQKTDVARKALGKDLLYSENEQAIENVKFYPSRDTLTKNKRTLTLTAEMKKEYEQIASEYYQKYEKQGLYSKEKLEDLESKARDYAKNYMMKKYKNQLTK